LPDALIFQRLPALNQSQPKLLVVGVAGSRGKLAAFIGPSPEFFCHVPPPESFSLKYIQWFNFRFL